MATPKTKTEATPKRKAASKSNPDRPVKPEFVVIEDNLHYSPDGEREIVVSIDPAWDLVEPIITESDDEESQGTIFKNILAILYGDDGAAAKIRGLKTSQFFKLAYRWMDEFTKQMGVDTEGE